MAYRLLQFRSKSHIAASSRAIVAGVRLVSGHCCVPGADCCSGLRQIAKVFVVVIKKGVCDSKDTEHFGALKCHWMKKILDENDIG